MIDVQEMIEKRGLAMAKSDLKEFSDKLYNLCQDTNLSSREIACMLRYYVDRNFDGSFRPGGTEESRISAEGALVEATNLATARNAEALAEKMLRKAQMEVEHG